MSQADSDLLVPGVAHAEVAHVVPMRVLTAVFVALVLLTALTVAASEIDLGKLNLYAAMAIAGTKATLVVLYFMHLRYDRPFHLVVFLGCLLFVVLFIGLTLTDIQASSSAVIPGQGSAMRGIHTPLGSPRP